MRKILGMMLGATVSAAQPSLAQAADELAKVGDLFCTLTRDGAQFEPQYLLTRALIADIATALKKNDEWAAANPGDKPPLGDGIQFASFPDGAPLCRPGAVTDGEGGARLLDIEYVVGAEPSGNWTDRLVLKTEDGLPRIDDVLYGTEKYELGLRKALVSVFKN